MRVYFVQLYFLIKRNCKFIEIFNLFCFWIIFLLFFQELIVNLEK